MMQMRFKTIMVCLSAFTVLLTEVLSQPGFTSIDCGLPLNKTNYSDEITGITYTSDQNVYIDRGVSSEVDPATAADVIYQRRRLQTVRYFPSGNGNMSCYDLSSLRAANKRYLIRAVILYGNYDGKNQLPTFDLYLGVELWETIVIDNSSSVVKKEIIHVCTSDRLYVCLVDSGTGTPFISALELRLLNQSEYATERSTQSLALFNRWNFAPYLNKWIRYPKDDYDRVWEPYPTPQDWIPLNTRLPVVRGNGAYHPPEAVMQSAATPQNSGLPMYFNFEAPIEDRDPHNYYAYFYFAELENLDSQYRGFYINLSDHRLVTEPVVPRYLAADTISTTIGITKLNFSLEKDGNSSLPPIINALEAYIVKQYSQSQTNETDVVAILNIKSAYGVKRDWQGDPCLPKAFMWDGLDCITSDDPSIPPRITSLNLSSGTLNGMVLPYFSSLAFLENLDLSDNNLNGDMPDFLADLPSLKVLHISGNKFSGSIPQKILDRAKSGVLQLRADGYECEGDKCKSSKKSNKLLVILISVACIVLVILAFSIPICWCFRRKKPKAEKLGSFSNRKKWTKKPEFTYADLEKMTQNFKTLIGEGGFAKVYHGLTADGKEVAVKLLKLCSEPSNMEIPNEAKLLTRVHHSTLTSLVGYCDEGSHMALVYEYMAGGSLKERLLGDDRNALSWLVRLHIARDTAEGLHYLHKRCEPPIIHRDVKPDNILLNEKDEAKLADFGISREYRREDGSYVVTRVSGTRGYIDPEYWETESVHEKSDVYSLGIVILQLITGRPAIIGDQHIVQLVSGLEETGDMRNIADPKLEGMYDVESLQKALQLAMACASRTSSGRPTMAQVLTDLAGCVEAESARIYAVNSKSFQLEIQTGS